MFDICVEVLFGVDIVLNFFHSYRDPENFKEVTAFKPIAHNYVFSGWFFVDFISVFPFNYILPGGNTGNITKLLRLFRLPRLMKLIDI